MEWISVKDKLPNAVKTEFDFKESDFVVVMYSDNRCNQLESKYEVAKYEEGEGWSQWYCPSYSDSIEEPDFWLPLPKTTSSTSQ